MQSKEGVKNTLQPWCPQFGLQSAWPGALPLFGTHIFPEDGGDGDVIVNDGDGGDFGGDIVDVFVNADSGDGDYYQFSILAFW